MELAEAKLGELAARLARGGGGRRAASSPPPRLRVVGDLGLLPPRVAAASARACTVSERDGAHARGPVVNVALAYTGREDAAQAAERCAEGVRLGWLHPTDCDAALLSACLHTSRWEEADGCAADAAAACGARSAVQLLLRTSGEQRLSDFMLVQVADAQLCFAAPLWPDLQFRHLVAALLRFQRGAGAATERARRREAARTASEEAWRLAVLRGGAAAPAREGAAACGCSGEAGAAGGDMDAFYQRFGVLDGEKAAVQAPASAEEAAALRALSAGRGERVAAFLRERERVLKGWMRAAADGEPPPWPPPLGERNGKSGF